MDRNEDALERRLQDAYRVEPPDSLRERLMSIPDTVAQPAVRRERERSHERGTSNWLKFAWPAWLGPASVEWRLALPAFAAVAAIAIIWIAGTYTAPNIESRIADTELTEQQKLEAMRDFVIVMRYLNASTAQVNRGVQNEIGTGLMTAFERGEQSFKDSSNRVTNGG